MRNTACAALKTLPSGQDQVDGTGKGLAWNFRELLRHFLEGRVLNAVSGEGAPAFDPKAAKAAITVVNQNRFFGSRGIHTLTLMIEPCDALVIAALLF